MPILAREPGTQVFREQAEHPDDEQVPGVVALRLDGGLFFATSDALEDRIREVIHSTPGLTGIVLDCEGIDFIDSQGSAKLGDIVRLTSESSGDEPWLGEVGEARHPPQRLVEQWGGQPRH